MTALLYWLVVTVLALAIPLALLAGVLLVLELRRPVPAPVHARRRARPEREAWIQDTLPERTPPASPTEPAYWLDANGEPQMDAGLYDRIRPYTGQIPAGGGV